MEEQLAKKRAGSSELHWDTICGYSSTGRATVSKTVRWVFESPCPCHLNMLQKTNGCVIGLSRRESGFDSRLEPHVRIAQQVRAPGCGPGGRGFEFRCAPQMPQ